MALEELRKQVEEENNSNGNETEEANEIQATETLAENPQETEAKDDVLEEFELELDGEPVPQRPKHTVEETLTYKLINEKKKSKKRATELDELKDKISRLEAGNAQQPTIAPTPAPQAILPRAPDRWDPEILGDEAKYNQAMYDYQTQVNAHNQQTQLVNNQAAVETRQTSERAIRLAQRSATFIEENKIDVETATDATTAGVEGLERLTGREGGGLYLLDSIGEGSEKVAYYLGRNPHELAKIGKLLDADPSGFQAIAELTRLAATRLKPKNRKLSAAPEPDEALQGESTTKPTSRLQSEYDKETDFNKLMKMRKDAKARGIDLK